MNFRNAVAEEFRRAVNDPLNIVDGEPCFLFVEADMMIEFTKESVIDNMGSTDEWMNTRANYAEYLAAFGPDATKTFRQFAYGIAAQNELYAALQETK